MNLTKSINIVIYSSPWLVIIVAHNVTWAELYLGRLIFRLGGSSPPKPMPGYVPDDWIVGTNKLRTASEDSVNGITQ